MAVLARFGAEALDRLVDRLAAAGTADTTVTRDGGRASWTTTSTATSAIDTGASGDLFNLLNVSGHWTYWRLPMRLDAVPTSALQIAEVFSSTTLLDSVTVNSDGSLSLGGSSSAAGIVTAGGWFVLELALWSDGTQRRIIARAAQDGGTPTQFADYSPATNPTSLQARVRCGFYGSGLGVTQVWVDDAGVNDDTGTADNSWPATEGRVRLLLPTADSAVGSNWTLGNGTAPSSNAFDSVNNAPPTGKSTSTAGAGDEIKDAVSSTASPASDADFTLQTYTAAGVPAGATITHARAVAAIGSSSAITHPLAALHAVSNPADSGEVTTAPGAASGGTYPTGWFSAYGPTVESPTPTLGTAPVVRVAKRTATTTLLMIALAGLAIEYTPATTGAQTVSPSAIPSGEAWGTPTITTGAVTVSPSAIASAEAWGTPIVGGTIIQASGIPPGEAWGTPTVTTGPVTVSPSGIASSEAWGTPIVAFPPATVSPSGIASSEAWGTPVVTVAPLTLTPVGIDSAEAWGTPRIANLGMLVLYPFGIPSGEAWGTPTITQAPNAVSPTGIASSEAWGTPTIIPALIPDPGGGPPIPNPQVVAPRAKFIDPRDLYTYEWAINPETDGALQLGRKLDHTAPNADVGVVRQQSRSQQLTRHFEGAMLDDAQAAALEDFFNRCEDTTIIYVDPMGDEYDCVVTTYDAHRVRTPGNPRHPGQLYYWNYTIELTIIAVRAGTLALVGS